MVVMNAPELSALVLLEHAIEIATLAVLAQHPALLDPDAPCARHTHPGALLTHSLFVRAHKLCVVVRRYRAAVSEAALAPSNIRFDREV